MEMNLTASLISLRHSTEHKFQIELVFRNSQQFQINLLIKTIKHVGDYIKSVCRQDINCEFDLILLRFSVRNGIFSKLDFIKLTTVPSRWVHTFVIGISGEFDGLSSNRGDISPKPNS